MTKAKDKFKIFILSMNIIIWTIVFAALILFDKAKPETQTILDIKYTKEIRDTWDMFYVNWSLWLFIIAAALSVVGLLVNIAFLGEKKYHLSYGLILSLLLSIVAASAYIINLL